jgi:hypothetical protein
MGPKAEWGQHAMHVVRVANPSMTNPISWRVMSPRNDCFAVFPSEGMLAPGQTVHLYFTVRPLGSLMTAGMEQIDSMRQR